MLGELLIYLESNQLRLRVGAVSRAKPYTRKAGTAQSESAQSAAQTRLVASLLERGVTLSNALDKEGKEVLKGGNGGKERIGASDREMQGSRLSNEVNDSRTNELKRSEMSRQPLCGCEEDPSQ